MSTKYEVIVKSAANAKAGTTHEVWFRLDGTPGSTMWFHFNDLHGDPERLFRPGLIASCVAETEKAVGDLESCWVKLHPEDGDEPELLLETVEVIHRDQSVLWRFDEWVKPGHPSVPDQNTKCDLCMKYAHCVASVAN